MSVWTILCNLLAGALFVAAMLVFFPKLRKYFPQFKLPFKLPFKGRKVAWGQDAMRAQSGDVLRLQVRLRSTHHEGPTQHVYLKPTLLSGEYDDRDKAKEARTAFLSVAAATGMKYDVHIVRRGRGAAE